MAAIRIMDIHRLQTFVRVYELKSFSRAAQDLYLAQPTISSHIAALERELNVSLFDRYGRSVLPTKAGDILYSHARELIAQLRRTISDMQILKGQVAGELKIGGSTIPGHYLLPDILAGFKKRYPLVDLELKISDSRAIEEDVLDGRLDIGVIGSRGSIQDVHSNPVMKDELVLIGSSAHIAAQGSRLTVQELPHLPWILREKGSGTRQAMEEGFKSIGLSFDDLEVSIVVTSTQAMLGCVQAGMGVSITSWLAYTESLASLEHVTWASIPEMKLERTFHAVYHARRELFPAVSTFLEVLQEQDRFPAGSAFKAQDQSVRRSG